MRIRRLRRSTAGARPSLFLSTTRRDGHRHSPTDQPAKGTSTVLVRFAAASLFATLATAGWYTPATAEDAPTSAPAPTPSAAEVAAEHAAPVSGPRLDEVVITGAPIPRTLSELAQPASVLEGEKLLVQQAPQLGEVLAREPGITQSYFGPGASRPIIRGLGGDNIRVLENGLATFDASAVSPDHAVALEPLLTKRIEVLRGPAALLYGPTAIGGVVNGITNRIPDAAIAEPVRGTVEVRGNSVNLERATVGYAEGGYEGFAYHVDGFGRKTDDLTIPGFARSARLRATDPLPPGEKEAQGTLPNSAIETKGGSGGLSYIGDAGYIGIAPSVYQTTYGTVAEPDVTIDLQQLRLDFAGALNQPLPHVSTIKAKLGLVDYDHTEFEGPEPGTVFKNRGYDLRLEGLHEKIGPLEGALGFESDLSDFSALGDEAFLPKTRSNLQSLFAFEEWAQQVVRWQGAARLDFAGVDADANPQFGPASSTSFVTGGASLGAVYTFLDPYALAVSLAYASRGPNAEELYADGPHLATAQFEVGDRNLAAQQSFGVDVALRKQSGPFRGSIGGFYNRFIDYIALLPTGEENPEFEIPIFNFANVAAQFAGMEAQAAATVLEVGPHQVDLNVTADYVYAQNLSDGQPLPYIPPFRFGVAATYSWHSLQTTLSLFQTTQQNSVPQGILPTDAYTMLNLGGSYQFDVGPAKMNLFLNSFNLLNQTAREAASVLKDVAPLPGAGVLGGIRVTL